MNERVIGFFEAMEEVRAATGKASSLETEQVSLDAAGGRVLAQALAADRDQPPFDRSTRDGYAVRSMDGASQRRVIGCLRAGEVWSAPPLQAGESIEIMTGAPLPPGADAVVMLEHVTVRDGVLAISHEPGAGSNVVPRGAELRAGVTALDAGVRLGGAEIAVAAAVGASVLQVVRRPRVAILSTGDELVEVSSIPADHQIRNSNSYALAALVTAAGGEAVRLPPARDTRESLAAALATARDSADLLLLSGGVSAGKYDLVEPVLTEAGATFTFTGVRMQPGKPLVFGELPALPGRRAPLPFFGLPGNPVSAQVTFHCFVASFLRSLGGEREARPVFALAELAEAVPAKLGLTRVLPARLRGEPLRPQVALVPWQGSGDQTANARATCYALLAEDRERFAAGEMVPVLLR